MKNCKSSLSQRWRRLALLLLMLGIISSLFSQVTNNEPNDFKVIMDRIKTARLGRNVTTTENSINNSLTLLNTNGSYSDIDYASRSQTDWYPITHLDRTREMIIGYGQVSNKYYNNEDIYNNIVNSLELWYAKKPTSTNWWYQQVATAQRMGELLIAMRYAPKQLSTDLETRLLQYMTSVGGDPKNQAGANKLDLAIHWIYRACLQENSTNLKYATDQAFYPLALTNSEGFQYDGSYFQHGPQLYIGGYGRVTIDGSVSVAQYMVDTPYALAGEKLNILSSFVRNTFVKTIRGQYQMYNVLGRGMTRKGALSQGGFSSVLEKLKYIDIEHLDEYNDIIKRLKGLEPNSYAVKPSNTQFWRGEYTLHQRPGFTFDVRMSSKRIARNENGNGENLKGFFLSDGGTDIAVEGDEYASILPVWDWSRVPGTTTPAMTTIPKAPSYIYYGRTDFAGGVSDGLYGITGFSLLNDQFNIHTSGQKSWFFFDKEVVCLGAGIKSTAAETINTSVNQCVLKGDVILSKNGTPSTLANGLVNENNPNWVWHNRIGYFFPAGGNISISNQAQTGIWYDINNSESKDVISKDVFSLWFNHGVKPTNESYAYIVVPNIESANDAQTYPINNIEILANTDSVQVVKHKELGIYGIVFFKKASFDDGTISIRADKGCALILKDAEKAEATIHVADPAQTGSNINLIVSLPAISGNRILECTGLAFPYAGASKEYKINNETPEYVPESLIDRTYVDAIEDSYVNGGTNANTNFGSANTLIVKKDSPAYAREAYIKFPIDNIDTTKLHKISISLYGLAANASAHTVQWVISHVKDNSWSESGITWNNKATPTTVIATSSTPKPEENILIDVTQFVLNEIRQGNKVLSIQINANERAADGKSDAQAYSREAVDPIKRPRIAIDKIKSEPTPEIKFNVEAQADSYVNGGTNANTNFGKANTLIVKKDSPTYAREAYIKFPISDIDRNSVNKVFMSLHVSHANTSAHTIRWVFSHVEDNNWDELGITWNNRPMPTTTIATMPTVSVGSEIQVDITNYVIKELDKGSEYVTIHIDGDMRAADGKSDAQFYSRESVNPDYRPHLIVSQESPTPLVKTISYIQENIPSSTALIYPNPVKAGDVVRIESNDSLNDIEISDISGRTILKTKSNEINTSGFVTGVYIVIIKNQSNNLISTHKLIIN